MVESEWNLSDTISELIHSRSYRKGYLEGKNQTLADVEKIISKVTND